MKILVITTQAETAIGDGSLIKVETLWSALGNGGTKIKFNISRKSNIHKE